MDDYTFVFFVRQNVIETVLPEGHENFARRQIVFYAMQPLRRSLIYGRYLRALCTYMWNVSTCVRRDGAT